MLRIHMYVRTYVVNRDHNDHVTLLVNLQSNHQSLSMEPAPVIALRDGEGLGRNLLE